MRRHLRHRVLPGAGHADRARRRGLLDVRSRRAAQGHGQEAEGQDSRLPREVRRRLRSPTASSAKLAEESSRSSSRSPGYGFNKSHAVAYGWIAYQTAYLKANYPLQYFAALMSSVRDRTDKLVEYIEEAKKMGIACCRPTSTSRCVDFAVVGPQIRFGLAAVKGVGEGAVARSSRRASAAASSPISSTSPNAIDAQAANRKVYEALIKCGALDSLPGNRAQLLDALDARARAAAREARDRESGQASLFGEAEADAEQLTPPLRRLPAPPMLERSAWEKETLGIFVSGHPLADVAEALGARRRDADQGAARARRRRAGADRGHGDERAPHADQGAAADADRDDRRHDRHRSSASSFPKTYPQLQGAFRAGRDRRRSRPRAFARAARDAARATRRRSSSALSVNEVKPFERRHVPPPPTRLARHAPRARSTSTRSTQLLASRRARFPSSCTSASTRSALSAASPTACTSATSSSASSAVPACGKARLRPRKLSE